MLKLNDSMFLVFEGPDGSGKTTQAKRLADRLAAEGVPTVLLRDPGDTEVGKEIRKILLAGPDMPAETELLLFAAARKALIEQRIRPALCGPSPRVVICDRFNASTLAYQVGGRGVDPDTIYRILKAAGCTRDARIEPTRTIYLDATYEQAMARRKASGKSADRMEPGEEFHERVRRAYVSRYKTGDLVFLAASAADSVADAVWNRITTLPHFTSQPLKST